MADPINGAVAVEEELVDYEEEEVPEGEAAKGDQVRSVSCSLWIRRSLEPSSSQLSAVPFPSSSLIYGVFDIYQF